MTEARYTPRPWGMNAAIPVMIERPHLIDDDAGEVAAILDRKAVRIWTYADDREWRWKMKMAREFVEGWHQALEAIAGRAA